MSSALSLCGCGCNPCVCVPASQGGGACLPTACVPRPTFFDGQAIAADDLNAVVAYARNQEAILARLLGGWGVLGGLRVDAAAGSARNLLGTGNIAQLSRNPQIVAGTRATVSPGVAIDSAGNKLVLCAPVTLDIAALTLETPQARLVTATCAELLGPECRNPATTITASEFFLVAELSERATRPVGRIASSGSCDPITGCEPSRTVEDVKLSLIASLPDSYQFTGCASDTGFVLPPVTLGQQGDPQLCRDEVFAFIDNVQEQLAAACCPRPVVVLAKVLLTRAPGPIAGGLPSVPQYLLIADAYPCRKPTFQVGWFTKTWPNVICTQATLDRAILPNTVIQTAGDFVAETVVAVPAPPTSSPFVFLTRDSNKTRLRAQLARPRLATSALAIQFSGSFVATSTSDFVEFRVTVDGIPVLTPQLEPLLTATAGAPAPAGSPARGVVRIGDVLPPSLLGGARAHVIEVQVRVVGIANDTGATFAPSTFDGASIVVQELAG